MLRVPTSLAEAIPLLKELHHRMEVSAQAPFVLASDTRLAARLRDDLGCLGFKPVHLSEPPAVIAAWMETRPPLMLVELRPTEHLSFCADLKLQPYLRDLPLVGLVADPGADTRNSLRDAGIDDWLVVPWTLSELAARMRGNTLRPLPPTRQDPAAAGPAAPVRVLVVDDDPFVQLILEHHFRRRKWEVTRLEDAVEAFDLVRVEPFDLVVADALVPPSGIFELLCNLRSLEPSRIPRVVVTGAQDPDATCVRALGWGADDFVAKPFNPAVLAARVGRLVRTS